MSDNETYTLNVDCSNCSFEGAASISKGTEVAQHPCPNCGTLNLRRHFDVVTESYS